MRIDYFENFIELAHCDSFSDAAKRLHISQPALSKQITQLEKEFGVSLFARNKPHVELTTQGKALLEESYLIVEHFQRAKSTLSKQNLDESNVLIIGGLNRNADVMEVITRALNRVGEENIDLVVKRRDFHGKPYLEQLKEDRIDLLFSMLDLSANPLDSDLEAHFLFNEPLVALMRDEQPLASRERLHLLDLSAETVIFPFGTYELVGRQIFEAALNRLGVTPNVRPVFFNDVNDFASIVFKDDILIIEAALFETFRFSEDIVAVPVDALDVVFPVYAIKKKDNTHKNLDWFIELITEQALKMIAENSGGCLRAHA